MNESGVTPTFSCIVADPPWKVTAGRAIGRYEMVGGKQISGVTDNSARKLAYPSMTVSDIAGLPVSRVAAENAHLYLWTVNKYLKDAFDVISAWGFKYSTTLVWAKAPMGGGLGGCYGLVTEYCLFARRGSLNATARIGRNWFNWKRPYDSRGKPKHSAKPPEFYEMVEQVTPGSKLEMFARSAREGWSSWGNEGFCDINLTGEV